MEGTTTSWARIMLSASSRAPKPPLNGFVAIAGAVHTPVRTSGVRDRTRAITRLLVAKTRLAGRATGIVHILNESLVWDHHGRQEIGLRPIVRPPQPQPQDTPMEGEDFRLI